jgi:hypothetical protein
MTRKIEVVTRRELLRVTRRQDWYAVYGFAPSMFRGELHAGDCLVIEAVEHDPDPRAPWRDEGGEA